MFKMKKIINTKNAPAALGPYSQAIRSIKSRMKKKIEKPQEETVEAGIDLEAENSITL